LFYKKYNITPFEAMKPGEDEGMLAPVITVRRCVRCDIQETPEDEVLAFCLHETTGLTYIHQTCFMEIKRGKMGERHCLICGGKTFELWHGERKVDNIHLKASFTLMQIQLFLFLFSVIGNLVYIALAFECHFNQSDATCYVIGWAIFGMSLLYALFASLLQIPSAAYLISSTNSQIKSLQRLRQFYALMIMAASVGLLTFISHDYTQQKLRGFGLTAMVLTIVVYPTIIWSASMTWRSREKEILATTPKIRECSSYFFKGRPSGTIEPLKSLQV
jgi:hypothetical protein